MPHSTTLIPLTAHNHERQAESHVCNTHMNADITIAIADFLTVPSQYRSVFYGIILVFTPFNYCMSILALMLLQVVPF